MVASVEIIESWPRPDAVASAYVFSGSSLAVCYETTDEQFAVVVFPVWSAVKDGGPNDEALHGHPLYNLGLRHYSIHKIHQSPWLQQLETQNAVHPSHSRAAFLLGKVHYLFALKEQVIECIVSQPPNPVVKVFQSRAIAIQHAVRAIEV